MIDVMMITNTAVASAMTGAVMITATGIADTTTIIIVGPEVVVDVIKEHL
jgi:hypothetical protein